MIQALGLEVAAIRKRGSGSQIDLRGGERIGRAEGNWLYRFVVGGDLYLRDDTPVRIIVEQNEASGVVVSFRDGVLVIAVELDLGPKIAFARLVANDSFLIERLKERLVKIRSGEAEFDKDAAERVIGLGKVRTGESEPVPIIFEDRELNDDQAAAVRRSLGTDTTFVWGPPGTGKTTTLARIVEAHYRAGRSVLLVSNTNIAVDTALEKIAERLKGEPDFHAGAVLRQGPVVKEELRQRFGPQVILELIVARLGERLRREKEQLERKVRELATEEDSLAVAVNELERLEDLRRALADLEKQIAATREKARAREVEAEQHRARSRSLRADLDRVRAMGSIRRFFSGLRPESLDREIAGADRAAQATEDAARALADDLKLRTTQASGFRAEIEPLVRSVRSYPALAQCRRNLDAVRNKLRENRERIAALDKELAAIEQEILARCRILATTVYRTYLRDAPRRRFDVVVVDEASMLMPPLVYYAAGLSSKAVTVAGDFRQLPPIVASDEPLAEKWLKRDVFEKAGIPEQLQRRQPIAHLVRLRTQYRMRESICDVVNQIFYADYPLRSDPSVERSRSRFPLGASSLLYVNTASFHPWTALRVGTYSRYNLFHALLMRNIVLHLVEEGYLPQDGENRAVGAVAPYSSQAKLIQALIEDRLGPRAAGVAATVHRFQGNEKDAILIDLTDSLGAKLGRFLQATRPEEDGARLLNVAASRARHHVVLVANFDYLRSKAPQRGIVRRLLDIFESKGEPLKVEDLLPIADRDWVDGLHRVLPSSFDMPESAAGAFTEGTFYPAFARDLERARESIAIFSPFTTGNGTGRWVDALRTALRRGARVRVVTRPPGESGGMAGEDVAELIRDLRGLGIAVDMRARMHEKVAIIDERILWHGSLNILSHRDTHESMLRIESALACAAVARFLTTRSGRKSDESAFHFAENPACPKCGSATVWNDGRYGVYFACERPECDGKIDPRRASRSRAGTDGVGSSRRGATAGGQNSSKARNVERRACPRPGCDGQLAERRGKYGRFLGCSNWRNGCNYTENLD